jgi:hypothetical protein
MAEPLTAELGLGLEVELDIAPPASGSIADVDRQVCLGTLPEVSDIAAEERVLVMVSQPGNEVVAVAEKWEGEMVIA